MDHSPITGTIRVPPSEPEIKELLRTIDGKHGVFIPMFRMGRAFGRYSGERALQLPDDLRIDGDSWMTAITWIPESRVQPDPDQCGPVGRSLP